MRSDDDIRYHSQRASQEMDLGLIASDCAAARAHLRLAAMHMERLRQLTGRVAPPLAM